MECSEGHEKEQTYRNRHTGTEIQGQAQGLIFRVYTKAGAGKCVQHRDIPGAHSWGALRTAIIKR